jgi:hypothetical protein
MTRAKQTVRKTGDGAKRKMVFAAKGKVTSTANARFGRIPSGTIDADAVVLRKTPVFKPATLLCRKARRAQRTYESTFTMNNTAVMSAFLVQQCIPGAFTSLSAGAVRVIRHLIINFVTQFSLAAAAQKHHRAPLSFKYSESDVRSVSKNCMRSGSFTDSM